MKIVITEKQNKVAVSRVENMIDNIGLVKTIKFIGGFESFNNLLPAYFYSKLKKIEFIEDAIRNEDDHGGQRIYLHELASDILYDKYEGDNGFTYEVYIDYVGFYNDRSFASTTTWEFDEKGEMFDEYYDQRDIWLTALENKYITEIFDMIFEYYLETQGF